jgi:hypothetical protein
MKLMLLLSIILIAAVVAIQQPQQSFAKKHHSDSSSPQFTGTTTSGDTFSQGFDAGKTQGKADAISGVDNNSCDVTIHSNDYCAGYKVGYRANHFITNLVR